MAKAFFDGEPKRVDPVAACPNFLPDLSYGLVKRGRRWYCFVRGLGRQLCRSLKTADPEEAKQRADDLVAILKRNSQRAVDGTSRERATLSEVISAYCVHIEAEHLAKRTLAKFRWVMKQIQRVARPMNVFSITGVDLGFLDAYRLRQGEDHAAPKTIYSEVITIKQLLNFAVNRGYLLSSPLKHVRFRRPKSRPQPFWPIEQLNLIIAASAQSPYHDLYLLLSETGMRVGEAKFLTWDDIDLIQRVIFIREKQIGRKSTDRWTPKTGEQRVVPLSPRLTDMLSSANRVSKWVLTRPNGRAHVGSHSQSMIAQRWAT